MPDDYQRGEDARTAAAARIAAAALEAAQRDRVAFWLTLDFNLGDPDDMRRLRSGLAWMVQAQEASVTRNKRILNWIGVLFGIITGLGGIIKMYLDWRHP